jgi:hypothetical protein
LTLSFVVDWLLLRFREVPGSNFGLETGYPEVFRGILHLLQAKAGIVH